VKKFVAIDLGAESGRVIVENISKIELTYRFPNSSVRVKNLVLGEER